MKARRDCQRTDVPLASPAGSYDRPVNQIENPKSARPSHYVEVSSRLRFKHVAKFSVERAGRGRQRYV